MNTNFHLQPHLFPHPDLSFILKKPPQLSNPLPLLLTMYKHRPLLQARSIRLLKLAPSAQPNDDEARLECELTEVALDCDSGSNTNTPSYEALSYSWDAQVPEVPVLCNGRELLVTRNCNDAMRRLRALRAYDLWFVLHVH